MMRSITWLRKLCDPKFSLLKKTAAAAFWLLVWHSASLLVQSRLVLVSPVEVLAALGGLVTEAFFWQAIAYSFVRIVGGFFAAFLLGIGMAALAARFSAAEYLFSPLASVIKVTPVASFVILALFWVGSRYLSVFTAFLMVLPVVYANILQGIKAADRQKLEMARVFRINPVRKLLYIYLPSLRPFVVSACSVSLGLCWKAGVAAEVIGQPRGSIGEQLYYAKIYFDTAGLFAWTATIILVSVLFERVFVFLVGRILDRTGRERKAS